MITIVQDEVGTSLVSAVAFTTESLRIVLPVRGIIGNSVATSVRGAEILLVWKRTIAAAAKDARGTAALDPHDVYSVSAAFSFHPPSHGNQKLDVENFLKPTFDALAAGLFCGEGVDCRELARFAYDDSGFRYLFAYRLPDAPSAAEEGVGLVVSIQERQQL